jgi:hypothetical protein
MVAMSRSEHGKRPHTGRPVGAPLATTTSVALIVTVLLVASCGQSTTRAGKSASHTTATPTYDAVPGPPLSWTAGSRPPGDPMVGGFGFEPNAILSLIISPSDGNTAYSCMWPASASVGPDIWVTHDRAQHWTQITPPPSAHRTLDICGLLLDAADPSIVVAYVSWMRQKDLQGAPPQIFLAAFTDFVSFDDGAHWQLLRGPGLFMPEWVATYHGTTVAELETADGSVNLWMSTDQMRSWRKLDLAPSGQLFINPSTGDLLMLGGGNGNPQQIYESSDLGQHWTSFTMPLNYFAEYQLVSYSVGDPSWHICGSSTAASTKDTYMCTMDSGRTWTPRPMMVGTIDNTDKQIKLPQGGADIALAPDGTIYVDVSPEYWPATIPPGLYQLPPQSTGWQSLNAPPPSDAVDVSSIPVTIDTTEIPGAGILWAYPGDPAAPTGENGPGFGGVYPAAGA